MFASAAIHPADPSHRIQHNQRVNRGHRLHQGATTTNPFNPNEQHQTQEHVAQANQAALQQRFNQMYSNAMARHNDVLSHEGAHASAAGQYGGGIHLDYQTMTVPMGNGTSKTITPAVGGHVPVRFPKVSMPSHVTPADIGRLQNAQGAFNQIFAAATAPQDMSGADSRVAATARSMANKMGGLIAQAYKNNSKTGNGTRFNRIA